MPKDFPLLCGLPYISYLNLIEIFLLQSYEYIMSPKFINLQGEHCICLHRSRDLKYVGDYFKETVIYIIESYNS